jgi:hypothetical protein
MEAILKSGSSHWNMAVWLSFNKVLEPPRMTKVVDPKSKMG